MNDDEADQVKRELRRSILFLQTALTLGEAGDWTYAQIDARRAHQELQCALSTMVVAEDRGRIRTPLC